MSSEKKLEAIVGDISYTPINSDQETLILNSDFLETTMDTTLIPSVESSLENELPFYILSLKVIPPFNTQENYKILLERFSDELSKHNVNSSCKIYSRVLGKREAKIFEDLGFKFYEDFQIKTSPLTFIEKDKTKYLIGCHCYLDGSTKLTNNK